MAGGVGLVGWVHAALAWTENPMAIVVDELVEQVVHAVDGEQEPGEGAVQAASAKNSISVVQAVEVD